MLVQRLTRHGATELIRHCLQDGEISYGNHFKQELAAEQASLQDAWSVLRTGQIYGEPERDVRTGEWKYRVEGHEPDGKWLAIVLCFKSTERAFLITVFSIASQRRPS